MLLHTILIKPAAGRQEGQQVDNYYDSIMNFVNVTLQNMTT